MPVFISFFVRLPPTANYFIALISSAVKPVAAIICSIVNFIDLKLRAISIFAAFSPLATYSAAN